MKREIKDYVIAVIGTILLLMGVYLVTSTSNPQGYMKALPYICIGLGSGIFGHSMGKILSRKAIHIDPSIEKQMKIQINDERNITISNKAKAKAYDLMTFVLGALMIIFALMGVELIAVLLLVFVYLFIQGYAIYYRSKYNKEM